MSTPAQIRATARYNAKNYEQVKIYAPIGWRDSVKAAADKEQKSLAGYIREALEEKMRRDRK